VSVPPRAARRVRGAWAELCAPTLDPAAFDPAMVSDLPEPVRRYLMHAIAPRTPLWQSVEISMIGHIKIGKWRPFAASQVVAPGRGYIWAADARLFGVPVIGYDRLSGGTGEMRWRLLDLVPVVSTDGPDMTRSAAGRLASEIALIPTAFGGAGTRRAAPGTGRTTAGRADAALGQPGRQPVRAVSVRRHRGR
jgi:hypothetical protein